jgi:Tat protein secretion system quality control protein TatD with DNase activity
MLDSTAKCAEHYLSSFASCCITVWSSHLVVSLCGHHTLLCHCVVITPCCVTVWSSHLFVSLCGHYTVLYHCVVIIPYCVTVWSSHLVVSLCGHYTVLYHCVVITPCCVIVFTRATRRNNPEDTIRHVFCSERSLLLILVSVLLSRTIPCH